MGGQRSNFFYVISLLEDEIFDLRSRNKYSQFTKDSLAELISAVTNGSWTTSDIQKFVARNYRLNSRELSELWAKTHNKKTITSSTMRTHIANTSSLLASMFSGCDYVNDCFVTENEIGIYAINEVVKSLQDVSKTAFELLYSELIERVVSASKKYEHYSIDECSAEVAFLAKYSINSIEKDISKLDSVKLGYLVRELMKEPINRSYGLNTERLAIIRQLTKSRETLSNSSETTSNLRGCITDDSIITNSSQVDSSISETNSNNSLTNSLYEIGESYFLSVAVNELFNRSNSEVIYIEEDVVKVLDVLASYSLGCIRSDITTHSRVSFDDTEFDETTSNVIAEDVIWIAKESGLSERSSFLKKYCSDSIVDNIGSLNGGAINYVVKAIKSKNTNFYKKLESVIFEKIL